MTVNHISPYSPLETLLTVEKQISNSVDPEEVESLKARCTSIYQEYQENELKNKTGKLSNFFSYVVNSYKHPSIRQVYERIQNGHRSINILHLFPDEVVIKIFRHTHLSCSQIYALSFVNKRWYAVSKLCFIDQARQYGCKARELTASVKYLKELFSVLHKLYHNHVFLPHEVIQKSTRRFSFLFTSGSNSKMDTEATLKENILQKNPRVLSASLNFFVSQGDAKSITILLKIPAFLDGVKQEGGHSLALFTAIRGGHVKCASLLLDAGINVSIKDTLGNSALTYAIMFNQYALIDKLIQRGADPDSQNHFHHDAFLIAAMHSTPALLKLFRKNKDINQRDLFRNTALILATRSNRAENVRYLLEAGADLSLTNIYGLTAQDCICDWNIYLKVMFEKHIKNSQQLKKK